MKFAQIFLLIVLTLATFFANAQESFEFAIPMAPEATEGNFPKKFQGNYSALNASIKYEVTADDIILHYTQYESMSKEYMDSDLKLYVIDSLLYGLSEKPIPVILENGRYYFGFVHSISMSEKGGVIRKIDDHNYVLNMKENDVYIPRLFTFVGRNLNIADFDYSTNKDSRWLKKIDHQMEEKDGLQHYKLKPSQRDWDKMLKKGYFDSMTMFVKEVVIN